MKLKLLSLYLIMHFSKKTNFIFAETASVSTYGLHGDCKGLSPVYDDHGNHMGYNGACDVGKLNESLQSENFIYPVDPNTMALHYENVNTHTIPKYEQPKNVSLFDWLSPHHDIVRNHPHYREAHLNHSHCIHKTKTGLFDFLGSLFNYDSQQKDFGKFSNYKDPYLNLDNEERCLNGQYYNNNSLNTDKKYYDQYALNLGHKIHHIKNQMNNGDPKNIELMKKSLQKHYNQLHRHLDCHCHHNSPQSQKLNIHHHPLKGHSMNIIADPISDSDNGNLHIYSPIPINPNMDMENEHMVLMRMANLAAQHAKNMKYFNDESFDDNRMLRMKMFHPVNKYVNSSNHFDYNSEWNRLKVEKVIVIKRIKVPVVTKVPVPIPVPVPYPIPSSNNIPGGDNQYLDFEGKNNFSQLHDKRPRYLGNSTYMIDTPESQPVQMNSVVRAISGYPCEPDDQDQYYSNSPYYQTMNQFENQNCNYNSVPDYRVAERYDMMNPPNWTMSAQTLIQPGLQIYPAPYAAQNNQCGQRIEQLGSKNQRNQPININLPTQPQNIPVSVTAPIQLNRLQ